MTTLLEVKNLKTYFPVKSPVFKRVIGNFKAVDDVSFSINRGETFGLVGESGCGKTTIGKSILRLVEPTAGEILFEGKDICAMNKTELRLQRRDMQIVFQDPYGSLNPRMTIGDIIAEPLRKHKVDPDSAAVNEHVLRLLDEVGLSRKDVTKYPHEFSGGQRQRICIARVLGLDPKLIVCDEPVSALDVSVQAQILNLLHDLQKEHNLSYLFIAHGMPAVRHISHRVGVMYMGKLVEVGDRDTIFDRMAHPYTQTLMSAVPITDPDAPSRNAFVRGEVSDSTAASAGCRFCPRCPYATEKCRSEVPKLLEREEGHFVACHYRMLG